jgi:hypothetical protein
VERFAVDVEEELDHHRAPGVPEALHIDNRLHHILSLLFFNSKNISPLYVRSFFGFNLINVDIERLVTLIAHHTIDNIYNSDLDDTFLMNYLHTWVWKLRYDKRGWVVCSR